MNKKLHLIIYGVVCMICLVLTVPAMMSCSDSDPNTTENKDDETISPEEQETMNRIALIRNVLWRLASVDSLTSDFYQRTYPPTYGTALDESNPFARAVKADSLEQAVNQFQQITERYDLDVNSADGCVINLKLPSVLATSETEDWGKLTFHKGDGTTKMGYVDVEIPSIPQLQRIDFIPSKLWGDNNKYETSPIFQLGELVMSGGQNGRGSGIWMCVRQNNGPYDCVLVHLDERFNGKFSTWFDDGKYADFSWSGWKPDHPADREHVEAFLWFLNKHRESMENNIKYVKKKFPNELSSICPPGFFAENGKYVYKHVKPAAIVRWGDFGTWSWFREYRTCRFYQLPKESEHGAEGSDRMVEWWWHGSYWHNDIYPNYNFSTISVLHFWKKPDNMTLTPIYDPVND